MQRATPRKEQAVKSTPSHDEELIPASQVQTDPSLQTPANILALQRTHGNTFVQRLLQRAQNAERPKAGTAFPWLSRKAVPVNQRSHATVIQRDVGFEFENSTWRAWIASSSAVRAAKRKEVLHNGTKFRVEGDDTPGPNLANMEFVTEPFKTDDSGLDDLTQALESMGGILTNLENYAGKPGPGPNDQAKLKSKHKYKPKKQNDTQNYVQSSEHQFSNPDALLSKGVLNDVKMQATSGIRLGDLPMVMKTFGKPAVESQEDTDRNEKARENVHPGAFNMVASMPALGEAIITELQQKDDVKQHMTEKKTHMRLTGFLSSLMQYLKGLRLPQGDALKYRAPLMLRQDFATLWGGVPQATRTALQVNEAASLIDAILNVSNNNPMIQGTNGKVDTGLTRGSALVPTHPKLASLTIERWLKGILLNDTDYLNPDDLEDMLKQDGMKSKHRTEALTDLESFATIGKLDKNKDGHRMGVFENRAIIGNRNNGIETMPFNKAARYAYNYLKFFVDVEERKAQEDDYQYPDNDLPDSNAKI